MGGSKMGTGKYSCELMRQVHEVKRTIDYVSRKLTLDYMESCVPAKELSKVRDCILTGCGDSLCSAIASRPVFENIATDSSTGMMPGIPTKAMRCIEFSRFYDGYHRFWPTDEKDAICPLVCGVSVSGRVQRVVEALLHANNIGGISVAITGNPEGALAKAAKYRVLVDVPPCQTAPCVTSYQTTMFALMVFGLHVSVATGKLTRAQAQAQIDAMLDFAAQYTDELIARVEQQMTPLAEQWSAEKLEYMEFIGDDADYATAFFGSAKMVEAFGAQVCVDDSEGWAHVSVFRREPRRIPTFFVANSTCASISRLKESIQTSVAMQRPTVVVTDLPKEEFPEEAVVVTLPKPRLAWMNPLMEYLPMACIAACMQVLENETPYRGASAVHKLDAAADRFAKSKLVVL